MKAAFKFEQADNEDFLIEQSPAYHNDSQKSSEAYTQVSLIHDAPLSEEEEAAQQRLALTKISQIFDNCIDEGIAPDSVAHAGIFQSLVVMVEIYGEEPVASLMLQIVEGIRKGRYTTNGQTH
jgi:hypothetical protein